MRRPSLRSHLRAYQEPQVTLGKPLPIPETRPAILVKILDRLCSTGAFLQEYSNGEFISASTAVGLTFEQCKAVHLRHFQIGEDKIGFVLLDQLQSSGARFGAADQVD